MLSIFFLLVESLVSQFTEIEYDPDIAALIQAVSPDSIYHTIASISGETGVTVSGQPDSIPVRYAYHPGSYRAALWIAERLESFGLETEIVPFIPAEIRAMDLLPWGQGWAVGWNGHEWTGHGSGILRTSDGGESWETISGIRGYGWESVVTLSVDSAWAASSEGRIGRTTDGLTWNYTVAGSLPLYDICFLDTQRGWAVGDSGVFLKTLDAWQTYSEVRILPDDLRHIHFISENEGWVASVKDLWHTIDGGDDWEYLDQPLAELTDLSLSDSLRGFLSGRTAQGHGGVCYTLDGGLNWELLIDTLTCIPRSLKVRGDTVWVAGDGGLIVASFDRGQSWTLHPALSRATLNCIDFLPDGRIVAVGDEEVFTSSNGETWLRPDTTNIGLMWNVAAYLPGSDSTRVMVTAHLDARSEDNQAFTPGADDNGTGVACVVEAARVLSEHNPLNSLEFVLFSGEEVGLFGSHRYVSEVMGTDKDILAVLNADMFGYDGNSDHVIDINSNPEDPRAQAAARMFLDVVDVYALDLTPVSYVADAKPNSDHYYFWQEMIPALFLNEDRNDYNPFYHTTGDRLEVLDCEHIGEGIRAAVGWLAHMAALDSLEDIKENHVPYIEPIVLTLSASIISYSGWVEITTSYRITPVIYDVSGRVVKKLTSVPPSSQPQRLAFDISDLPCGVYWLGISRDRGLLTEKFTVIR